MKTMIKNKRNYRTKIGRGTGISRKQTNKEPDAQDDQRYSDGMHLAYHTSANNGSRSNGNETGDEQPQAHSEEDNNEYSNSDGSGEDMGCTGENLAGKKRKEMQNPSAGKRAKKAKV